MTRGFWHTSRAGTLAIAVVARRCGAEYRTSGPFFRPGGSEVMGRIVLGSYAGRLFRYSSNARPAVDGGTEYMKYC